MHARGPGRMGGWTSASTGHVSALAVAGTLLVLWCREAGRVGNDWYTGQERQSSNSQRELVAVARAFEF